MKTLGRLLLTVLLSATALYAQDDALRAALRLNGQGDSCARLLRDCQTTPDISLPSCYRAAASHVFCSGSPLVEIVKRRLELSSQTEAQRALPIGEMNQDSKCLSDFDAQFTGFLLSGLSDEGLLAALRCTLNRCAQNTEIQ